MTWTWFPPRRPKKTIHLTADETAAKPYPAPRSPLAWEPPRPQTNSPKYLSLGKRPKILAECPEFFPHLPEAFSCLTSPNSPMPQASQRAGVSISFNQYARSFRVVQWTLPPYLVFSLPFHPFVLSTFFLYSMHCNVLANSASAIRYSLRVLHILSGTFAVYEIF